MKNAHFAHTLQRSYRSGLILVACTLSFFAPSVGNAKAEEKAAPEPRWDMIAFEVKTFGQTVTRWQYTPDFGGAWIEVSVRLDAERPTETHQIHTLEESRAKYDELERILSELPPRSARPRHLREHDDRCRLRHAPHDRRRDDYRNRMELGLPG